MDIASMEPLVPAEGAQALEDEVVSLIAESNQLAGRMHPILRDSIGDLVRSMNCYYSNLIEGHDTHPRDIDRALANDFSSEPKKRELQKEAVAHIHVQQLIDNVCTHPPARYGAAGRPISATIASVAMR
jgi:Fic family protein